MGVGIQSNKPRLVVVSALLIIVVALAVFAIAASMTTPSETPEQAVCRGITELNRSRGEAATPVSAGGGPVTVVIGDSYAQGATLPAPREQSWPTELGRDLRRTVWVNAVGSTGYANPGRCGGQAYPSRVADVLTRRPELVIVQGGLNDSGFPPDRVQAGVSSVLAMLRQVPQVVLVGPTPVPAIPRARLASVDTILASAAAEAGRPYLSALGWQLPYGPDGVHPTPDGQTLYGEMVTDAIERLKY